ncbi:MAG: hypothetical protein COU47_02000 [Candidatus Niyogibacteria bacterium CG10_big_fil_rev_8_21_14_0_10_46_36]|uniref:Type II secretion system protein GspG C-terminal domain-containing protein n=1 Tax=Candidatus Niyogibacteria bacterium CG10_big_fil_rev_8_21_14_0_10_46_36 TaxID=1974726 RepID=A0A2H0TDM4_9BACT|nr:MAG: hypothetical protein COU47_02000 [Candidatus Niyogibacteria bacterium CG10_big_fil_rev_8_21_14_0_10_46_36]
MKAPKLNQYQRHMLAHKKKNVMSAGGFTILELLVVLAIIGMLASFVFVQTGGFRSNSRDANREESIKQLQNGLDLYHVTHLRYPICSEVVINGTTDCLSAALVGDGAFNAAPTDPLGPVTGTCGDPGDYVFCYESTDGVSYTIQYHLETDTVLGKSAGWQTVGP